MRRITVLAVLLVFVIGSTFAQQKVDQAALHAYFEKMTQDWDVPSVAIGVVKDGALVFSGSYGLLEKGKKGAPNNDIFFEELKPKKVK